MGVYDDAAPLLHDLISFFALRGDYDAIDPPKALLLKTELDKTFDVHRHLFRRALNERYEVLHDLCFDRSNTREHDTVLRASVVVQRERREKWDEEWERLFASETRPPDPLELLDAYESLMDMFSSEIGVAPSEEDSRERASRLERARARMLHGGRRLREVLSRRHVRRANPALERAAERVRLRLLRLREIQAAATAPVTFDDDLWFLGEEVSDFGAAIVETNAEAAWRDLHQRLYADVTLGHDLSKIDAYSRELERLLGP
jgi:hypothetical protein